MAMLDMLQLPDGSFGLPPPVQPDPFTGLSPAEMAAQAREAGADRTRRGIRRPALAALDYGDWASGASPIPFSMLSNLSDAASLAPAASMAAPAAAPAASASAEPSWLGMLNGAPMPRPMDPGGYSVPSRAIPPPPSPPLPPPSLTPTAPAAPAASPAAATAGADIPDTSLLGRLKSGLSGFDKWRGDNRLTLMALGAGLAGAQSLGQGLNRGMTMAIPAMQADITLQRQNQTVDALVKRGLPRDAALAAVANPAVLQQILPQMFGVKQRQFTQIGEDAFGNKQFGFVDPVANKVYQLNGTEVAGAAGVGSGSDFLAKGVTSFDHSLTGNDYLAQFSPEVQAAVRNYVAGESMPTGNPRKGFTQTVKMIAQKFGQDTGVQVDDNTYAAKHKMLTGLASTAPGGIGGQMTYARTSLNHLADVGEAAVDLNNSNGLGIAPLATLINSARGLSTDQAAKVAALADKTGHYGEEITKYYAGSPGGEQERIAFLDKLRGSKSSAELAAVLQSELELARGKMSKTQATIDETMGAGSRHQVLRPEEQKDIGRVEAAIAKLRGLPAPGGAPAPAAAAPSGPPASGSYIWTPDKGLVPAAAAAPQRTYHNPFQISLAPVDHDPHDPSWFDKVGDYLSGVNQRARASMRAPDHDPFK